MWPSSQSAPEGVKSMLGLMNDGDDPNCSFDTFRTLASVLPLPPGFFFWFTFFGQNPAEEAIINTLRQI